MNILVAENEKPIINNLQSFVDKADYDFNIAGVSHSITETVNWLNNNATPDLIFMDVELSDGVCFPVFKQVTLKCPVIFTSRFDAYMQEAFKHNCIDYLIKPLTANRLKQALEKYKNFCDHFVNNHNLLNKYLNTAARRKSRIVAKKGEFFMPIKLDDIVYFSIKNKTSFLVNNQNSKYVCEPHSLHEIERSLDTKNFFRVNRKYILNVNYINTFKSIQKSKIYIETSLPLKEKIIVSQENASGFKKWINHF